MPLVELPAGEIHLSRPLVFPKGAHNIRVVGNPSGTTLVLDSDFPGSAAVVIDGSSNVTLSGFSIIGDRGDLKSDWYFPLKEAAFADYYTANGVAVRKSADVTIRGVRISRIRAFPIIVNATSKVLIDSVTIKDSGTLNRDGHNNTTGGILLEEGSSRISKSATQISCTRHRERHLDAFVCALATTIGWFHTRQHDRYGCARCYTDRSRDARSRGK